MIPAIRHRIIMDGKEKTVYVQGCRTLYVEGDLHFDYEGLDCFSFERGKIQIGDTTYDVLESSACELIPSDNTSNLHLA